MTLYEILDLIIQSIGIIAAIWIPLHILNKSIKRSERQVLKQIEENNKQLEYERKQRNKEIILNHKIESVKTLIKHVTNFEHDVRTGKYSKNKLSYTNNQLIKFSIENSYIITDETRRKIGEIITDSSKYLHGNNLLTSDERKEIYNNCSKIRKELKSEINEKAE